MVMVVGTLQVKMFIGLNMKLIKTLKPLTNYVLRDSNLSKSKLVIGRYVLTSGCTTYKYNYAIN